MNVDFDPEKAFAAVDQDRDGQISAYDLFRFMREALSRPIALNEADALVKEFDGNLDGRLNYQEFTNLVLPATSWSLRDISLKRPNASLYDHSYRYRPLPYLA